MYINFLLLSYCVTDLEAAELSAHVILLSVFGLTLLYGLSRNITAVLLSFLIAYFCSALFFSILTIF